MRLAATNIGRREHAHARIDRKDCARNFRETKGSH